MSLAERVRTAQPSTMPGPKCNVRKIEATLDAEDAAALREVIYDRTDLTAPEVADLLSEEDIDLSPDTIRRHRLNRCVNCKRR